MDPEVIFDERRHRAALHRLGSNHPICVGCGESDWRCLELHHVAGRAYDGHTAILCRNCHRKLSDPAANAGEPTDPPLMERVGRYLLGLAALLLAITAKLEAFGRELIAGAAVCPRPYGWANPAAGGA